MLSHHYLWQLLLIKTIIQTCGLSVDNVVCEPVELCTPLKLLTLLDLRFEMFSSHLITLPQNQDTAEILQVFNAF